MVFSSPGSIQQCIKWHRSEGQLNGVKISVVRIFLSCLCWNLARTLAGRDAGLNSMRNLVVEGVTGAVTVIEGGGAELIAVATACATAVAMSVGKGAAGAGAAAGAAAAGAGGAAGAGAVKPVAESVISVPHCR